MSVWFHPRPGGERPASCNAAKPHAPAVPLRSWSWRRSCGPGGCPQTAPGASRQPQVASRDCAERQGAASSAARGVRQLQPAAPWQAGALPRKKAIAWRCKEEAMHGAPNTKHQTRAFMSSIVSFATPHLSRFASNASDQIQQDSRGERRAFMSSTESTATPAMPTSPRTRGWSLS